VIGIFAGARPDRFHEQFRPAPAKRPPTTGAATQSSAFRDCGTQPVVADRAASAGRVR
jgi:hypothetical protein